MRILHVIHTLDPTTGGPIEGVRQMGARMTALGHEVEVLCEDLPEGEFVGSFPLPVHAIGPLSGGRERVRGLESWLCRQGEVYDALVGNAIWQPHNLALRRAARRLGKPYWLFAHGMLDPYFNRAYPLKALKKRLYWPLQHAALRDAEAVLFTCEEERLLARESFRPYRVRERVVSYGTAAPEGEPEAQRRAFGEAFPDLTVRRFLLFLSRVHPKKGVDLLLRAFTEGAKSDLHLAIAGPVDVAYRAELQRLVAGTAAEARVHWLGMLQGDVKWGAFRAAEAFVLPSHQENFGIAVAEAMACGLPVLITRRVNIWREIEADGAGLVGEDTSVGVSELLARWGKMPLSERRAVGESALRCFEGRFTIDRSAESFLQALEEGLARRRS